ncbi:MAG: hypothetical protein DRJ51_05600 [Thermoprotei archaeon]|nr:MAG: hypothetical protein DRJ51_05600 [Thermoprotei archaeon]
MTMLRAIALSDIHGRREAVRALLRDVRQKKIEVDYIFVAGDIGCPEDPNRLLEILRMLRRAGLEVFYIVGNWDIGSRIEEMNGVYNLDRTGPIDLHGFSLVGHGEFFEEHKVNPNNLVVLLSHYPPYGILDRGFKYTLYRKGSHTGIIRLNHLIEHYRPLIHVFGHAHKSGGLTVKLNGVYFVNVARLDRFTRDDKCIGNYTVIIADKGSPPKIRHMYIGGVYKICTRCGRKVLMPPSWNVCKECMMRDELLVSSEPITKKYGRIKIQFHANGADEATKTGIDSLGANLSIPLTTMRTRGVLREFIEDSVREEVYNRLLQRHKQVFALSKDSLLYVYPCPLTSSLISPFILRLLKCKSCTNFDLKNEACIIFRTLLNYKSEVIWGMSEIGNSDSDSSTLERQKYILVFKSENKGFDEKLLEGLKALGFNVILVSLPSELLRREVEDEV